MKGDFTGFAFDGVHSSRLGITRVSSSDRYNESLTPELEDKIVAIPGRDGSYFFGSLYRNREITLSIAFDSMSESQFRQLRKLLAIKKPCKLILDERPYKVYTVKISAPPQLNYICFDEPQYYWEDHSELENNGGYIPGSIDHKIYTGKTKRTYKGEGTIEFVCMTPYATEQFKSLDQYGDYDFESAFYTQGDTLVRYQSQETQVTNIITKYNNIEEWAESSGILPKSLYDSWNVNQVGDTTQVGYNKEIPVYNAGDIDTPFYLFLPFDNGQLNPADGGDYVDIVVNTQLLRLSPFTSNNVSKENGVVINTSNHLIEGVLYDISTSTWRTTGNIYNEYIVAGDFAKIKANDWSAFSTYDSDHMQTIYLNCATAENARIHYNYLYY